MPLFPPVFAKGQSNLKTVSAQSIGSSSTTLTLNNVTSLSVGMHAFSSDAGGGNSEYLGKITAIAGSDVTVRFVARFARVSGAAFWTPIAVWQATTVIGLGGQQRSFDNGLELLDTTGAHQLQTQVRDRRDYKRLMFSQAKRTDWVAFDAWCVANLNGSMMGSFTAAWLDSDFAYWRCCKVQFRNANAEQMASHSAYLLRTWEPELCVLTENGYY
jgi:hypothetical protein